MSQITDRVKAYRTTHAGWPLLCDWLASKRYPDPERYSQKRDVSDDLVPYSDGTWDEVRRCRNIGLLSDDEYVQVLRAADQLRAQSPVDDAVLQRIKDKR